MFLGDRFLASSRLFFARRRRFPSFTHLPHSSVNLRAKGKSSARVRKCASSVSRVVARETAGWKQRKASLSKSCEISRIEVARSIVSRATVERLLLIDRDAEFLRTKLKVSFPMIDADLSGDRAEKMMIDSFPSNDDCRPTRKRLRSRRKRAREREGLRFGTVPSRFSLRNQEELLALYSKVLFAAFGLSSGTRRYLSRVPIKKHSNRDRKYNEAIP